MDTQTNASGWTESLSLSSHFCRSTRASNIRTSDRKVSRYEEASEDRKRGERDVMGRRMSLSSSWMAQTRMQEPNFTTENESRSLPAHMYTPNILEKRDKLFSQNEKERKPLFAAWNYNWTPKKQFLTDSSRKVVHEEKGQDVAQQTQRKTFFLHGSKWDTNSHFHLNLIFSFSSLPALHTFSV